MLNDSDRGGRLGSEILLATLWGMAGELWRLSRERSSTCGDKKPFPVENQGMHIHTQEAFFPLGVSYILYGHGIQVTQQAVQQMHFKDTERTTCIYAHNSFLNMKWKKKGNTPQRGVSRR